MAQDVLVRTVNVSSLDAEKPKVHTRPEVLNAFLQPIFQAHTKRQLEHGIAKAIIGLEQTGAYKRVELTDIQTLKDGTFQLEIGVVEAKFTANTGCEFGRTPDDSAEARAIVSGSVMNLLGAADTLSASLVRNHLGSDVLKAEFYRPVTFGRLCGLRVSGFSDTINYERRSSVSEWQNGITASLLPFGRSHEFSYGLVLRDLYPSLVAPGSQEATASAEVVAASQPSFKSSLKYAWNKDRRLKDGVALAGWLGRVSVEGAGLGGDVRTVKVEASGEQNWTVFRTLNPKGEVSGVENPRWWQLWKSPGITAQVSASLGAVLPWGGATSVPLSDRFFSGGTASFRGFGFYGVGPRADRVVDKKGNTIGTEFGDALGGNGLAHATARLLLPPPLPWSFLVRNNARTQLFGTVGNVGSFDSFLQPQAYRAVAGVGMVIPLPANLASMGVFEINFPFYRVARPQDVVVNISFGLSG